MKVRLGDVQLNEEFDVFVTKRPLPEFRASGTTIYGRNGEDFENATIGTRTVELTLVAHDNTKIGLQDAARRLTDIIAGHNEPVNLRIADEKDPDGNQLYRRVVPIGTPEYTPYVHAGMFVVKFKQFSPFLYGKQRTEVLTANQWKGFDTGGSYFAWPEITAYPSSSSYTIEKSGGEWLTYKAPMAGKKLIIDTHDQVAKCSPSASGDGLQIGSRFFSIEGAVLLKANAKTEITWRERWL